MNSKKKWICLVAFLGAMVALTVFPNSAEAAEGLWVNGVLVTAENADDVLGDADGDAASVRYDAETQTIILEDATLSECHLEDGDGGVIFSNTSNPLTVQIEGENTISSDEACAVNVYGSLTLTGSGLLTATSTSADFVTIFAEKDIVINGGTYHLTNPSTNPLFTYSGAITLTGSANVTTNGFYGIQSGWFDKLLPENGITISGDAVVDATSTDDCAICTPGAVHVADNADVTANGYYAALRGDAEINIDGNSRIEATSSNDIGIWTQGVMHITDKADVTANGYYAALRGDAEIKIDGSSSVNATSSDDIAIWVKAGPLTVSGDATVRAESGAMEGVYADGNLHLSDNAQLTAIAASAANGVYADGDLLIENNAALTVTSGGDYGVYTRDNIQISGGTLAITANGGTGLCNEAGTVSINGGTTNITAAGAGIHAKGDLMISGADTTVKASAGGERYTAMVSDAALVISDGASVTANSRQGAGLQGKTIAISGAGTSVTASAGFENTGAIISDGALSITDHARVAVSGAGYGIYSFNEETAPGAASGITIQNSFVSTDLDRPIFHHSIYAPDDDAITINDAWLDLCEPDLSTAGLSPENSLIITGKRGFVFGQFEMPVDASVPADVKLTIYDTSSLTIPTGVTLTNFGTIVVDGEDGLVNHGRLLNYGTIQGKVSGDGDIGVVGITLNETALHLYTNGQAQLTATVAPEDASHPDVTWTSDNDAVATVDAQGVVQAKAVGTATITATAEGVSASCVVTVENLPPSAPTYDIDVQATDGGALDLSHKFAVAGATVSVTVQPEEGYKLDSLTVTDADGNAVEVKALSDNRYSFKMPKSDVTVQAQFVRDGEHHLPFVDVHPDDWFYGPVGYVYDHGLMTGTSATEFSPNLATTRGMFVTMLYRLEGEPDISDDILGYPFADVDANAYYADAVYWARMNGIVNGMSDEMFAPNSPLTREQLAAMLQNYAAWKGADVSNRADLSAYSDAASVSGWARDAVEWAVAEEIVSGMTADTLAPQGEATRAQVAAIMQRFLSE